MSNRWTDWGRLDPSRGSRFILGDIGTGLAPASDSVRPTAVDESAVTREEDPADRRRRVVKAELQPRAPRRLGLGS